MRDSTYEACVVCDILYDPWYGCECGKCGSCSEGCSCGHDYGCVCEECVDRAAGHYGSDGCMAGGDS